MVMNPIPFESEICMLRFILRSKIAIALLLVLVFTASVGVVISVKSGAKAASAAITLNVKTGPPTSPIKVSGTGFGTSETVNINFDTTLLHTVTSSTSGTFLITVSAPSTALPGPHTISATGQISRLTASASFLVRTDWDKYGFRSHHTHYNFYENVVSYKNVSTLIPDWTGVTTETIASSPTIVNGIAYVGSSDGKLYAYDATVGSSLARLMVRSMPIMARQGQRFGPTSQVGQ